MVATSWRSSVSDDEIHIESAIWDHGPEGPLVLLRQAHPPESIGQWVSGSLPHHIRGRTCDAAVWLQDPFRVSMDLVRAVKACLISVNGREYELDRLLALEKVGRAPESAQLILNQLAELKELMLNIRKEKP